VFRAARVHQASVGAVEWVENRSIWKR